MRRVIHLELGKQVKFDHSEKWFMHKPEIIKENKNYYVLSDFEIKMNHPILYKMKPSCN